MAESPVPVGIDLGTTFSAIAHLDSEGRPCTIANCEGELTTPSVVFFDRDTVIVGSEAAIAGESEATRLARAAKRDMGGTRYRKTILDRHLPPEVIQSYVLKRLKDDAALKLGEFTQAVITVPAYFTEPRRKSTQDAGKLAGLNVIDIINEPTAAALAYGIQREFLNHKGESFQKERVLVYDLGGGTFDATLMEIDNSDFTAIATGGDVHLGGIDWDARLYDFAKTEIESKHQVDFATDLGLQEKLMNQCVRAKKSLTARTETVIRIESKGQRYTVSISRRQFENLTKDLLERTRMTTKRLLNEANLGWKDLTRLLLVGGSTRMPMVLGMLELESGLKVDRSLSPDESVAHGAAIYAGILMKHGASAGMGISIVNVNSHDLGVLGIDPQTREPRRKIVIPRNHPLPSRSAKRFQISKDGQTKIVVQIVEGGTDEGHGVTTIGKCVVTDLPADIKQGTEVVVTFNYLSSGRLEVLAKIPSLKIVANSTIDRASGMTTAELERWKQKIVAGAAFLEAEPPLSENRKAAHPKSVNRPPDAPAKQKTPPAKRTPTQPLASKTNRDNFPEIDFEINEQSGIFLFGDEEAKPKIGSSVLAAIQNEESDSKKSDIGLSALDFLNSTDTGKAKPEPGESALDFLIQTTEPKLRADNSELDDFQIEVD